MAPRICSGARPGGGGLGSQLLSTKTETKNQKEKFPPAAVNRPGRKINKGFAQIWKKSKADAPPPRQKHFFVYRGIARLGYRASRRRGFVAVAKPRLRPRAGVTFVCFGLGRLQKNNIQPPQNVWPRARQPNHTVETGAGERALYETYTRT